jgi:hypothetical protein
VSVTPGARDTKLNRDVALKILPDLFVGYSDRQRTNTNHEVTKITRPSRLLLRVLSAHGG